MQQRSSVDSIRNAGAASTYGWGVRDAALRRFPSLGRLVALGKKDPAGLAALKAIAEK
jgi:hypothetical protein